MKDIDNTSQVSVEVDDERGEDDDNGNTISIPNSSPRYKVLM